MDYKKIVKSLRICSDASRTCDGCIRLRENGACAGSLGPMAADAIEELLAEVQTLKNAKTVTRHTAPCADPGLLFPAPQPASRSEVTYIMGQDGDFIYSSKQIERWNASREHYIVGQTASSFSLVIFGKYPDDETARAALQGLLYALASGAPSYQLPPAPGKDEIPAWSETVKSC